MKKLLVRDHKIRFIYFYYIEKKHFILKLIFKNFNFFNLIKWNALLKLETLTNDSSRISIVHRCLLTSNKKRYSILTVFSRHIFIKLIQKGLVLNFQKSS